MKYFSVLSVLIFVLLSCKKSEESSNILTVKSDIIIMESVGDTLLPSDTCYALRPVSFQCTKEIINPDWTIGINNYGANVRSVNLTFPEAAQIDVTLKGTLYNHTDTVIRKRVTIVNPLDFSSPLSGEYLGSNTDLKTDTFRINIDYWYGSRYPWWSNGAYSITNLPHHYADVTQNFNGYTRPEIKGIIASTGYRNMAFDRSGNISALGIKGYASLKRGIRDTLVVNYTLLDTANYRQNNVISYINKTFIGIKN